MEPAKEEALSGSTSAPNRTTDEPNVRILLTGQDPMPIVREHIAADNLTLDGPLPDGSAGNLRSNLLDAINTEDEGLMELLEPILSVEEMEWFLRFLRSDSLNAIERASLSAAIGRCNEHFGEKYRAADVELQKILLYRTCNSLLPLASIRNQLEAILTVMINLVVVMDALAQRGLNA